MALNPESLASAYEAFGVVKKRYRPYEGGVSPAQLQGNGSADLALDDLTPLSRAGSGVKVWSAADGANETFVITAAATTATDGTFTLTFEGETTAAIAHDAAAATILAALNALGSISPGDVTVTDAGSGLGTNNGTATIVFQGQYANQPVSMTADFALLVGDTHVLSNSVQGEGSDIVGFLAEPKGVTQFQTGEVFIAMLKRGEVLAEDVPLPAGEVQAVLDAALAAPSLRMNGLDIRGLEGSI